VSAVPLDQHSLSWLGPAAGVPAYDRSRLKPGLFHIGVGGFHRAHQAVYIDELLHQSGTAGWSYCGIGLLGRDATMRDALRAQDGLYTVIERSPSGERCRVVGSIVEYLYAPESREKVLTRLADPDCRVVSLTITEGGYYLDDGTGEFSDSDPDVVHDLAHPHEPLCSFGYLLEALDRRRRSGLPPFTILSCDNLQHNGDLARRMLLAFAELRDPALHRWVRDHVAFPNTMVDRIVPATTDAHRALLRERFGIEDAWPVVTEPFRQWVVEDRFSGGRPPWERVGVQMTSDVEPYEKMRMRLLNGSHQALCYVGMLLGHGMVHEAMNDPHVRRLVQTLMDFEVTPLLRTPPGIDLDEYKATLLDRLTNPAVGDALIRIGSEGSARMPKFVLPTLREQLERDGPIDCLAFTVACWFRFLGWEERERKGLGVNDPLAAELTKAARQGGDDPRPLLSLRKIFDPELAANPRLVQHLRFLLESLRDKGPAATLASVVTGGPGCTNGLGAGS
jgi:mannitol 2-dehydrogenase